LYRSLNISIELRLHMFCCSVSIWNSFQLADLSRKTMDIKKTF
jgi:hypothetical protein